MPEGIDLILHLRQPAEERVQSLEFPQRAHRHTPVHFTPTNNLPRKDPCLGADHGPRLHTSVIAETNLPADNCVLFNDRATETCLSQ